MSTEKDKVENEGRRNFVRDITAGAAGAALVTALGSLGCKTVNAATGKEIDTTSGATKKAAGKEGEQAVSSLFKDPPPWPKGTDGHLYDHLFSTSLRENSIIPDIVPGPQAYFRGDSDLKGAKINMGWQVFQKPYKLEMESHHHDTDEYLFFLGAELPDLVGSFDGEIEYFMGPEYERHIIKEATVLMIPAGLEHNPCDIRRLTKPMMFSALQLAPFFNGTYQTMGHMEFKTMKKIK